MNSHIFPCKLGLLLLLDILIVTWMKVKVFQFQGCSIRLAIHNFKRCYLNLLVMNVILCEFSLVYLKGVFGLPHLSEEAPHLFAQIRVRKY